MDKLDSFQTLHRLFLSHRRPIPLRTLADRLECSEKTVRRLLDDMRNRYCAPVVYHPLEKGWHYNDDGDHFSLPGIWLTSDEIQTLALLIQLLNHLGETVIGEGMQAVQQHLDQLLTAHNIPPAQFSQLIKIVPINQRQLRTTVLSTISSALINQKQLELRYLSYEKDSTLRTISPQKLLYYRDNWYLDAWCHLRKGLRTFALTRITHLQRLNTPAQSVSEDQLQRHFEQGYGIFSGTAVAEAHLRFDARIAHDIATQEWHPNQRSQWVGDELLLVVPFSDTRELLQDILRHSPHVAVESPPELRQQVICALNDGLDKQKSTQHQSTV